MWLSAHLWTFYGSDSGKPHIIWKNSSKSFCHLCYNPPASTEITANQDCPILAAAMEIAVLCLGLFALWNISNKEFKKYIAFCLAGGILNAIPSNAVLMPVILSSISS